MNRDWRSGLLAAVTIIMLHILGSVPAQAATLFVDQAAPVSDQAVCTEQAPCRTIQAALNMARPGDIVDVRAGIYREMLDFPRSGSGPQNRIVLRAAPHALVEIKGSDPVNGWLDRGDGIWSRPGWSANSQQVFVDGALLRQIGSSSPFHHAVNAGKPFLAPLGEGLADLKPGSFFHDPETKILFVRLAPGDDPNLHLVEASVRPFTIVPRERDFIELDNLHFAHSNVSALGIYGSMANVWGRNWLVRGCSFRQADFSGLAVVGENHRIENCEASDNGNIGITVIGSDEAHGWAPVPDRKNQSILITGCRLERNNTRGFDPAWQAGGLKAATSCSGLRLSGLIAANNAGPGIWIDHFCRDVLVEGCLSSGNTVGFACEISDQVLFRNNVALNNDYGFIVSASSDVAVVNNTLQANTEGLFVGGLPRDEHPRLERMSILNNLFSDTVKDDCIICDEPGKGATDFRSDYNVYLRDAGEPVIAWTCSPGRFTARSSLAESREAHAQEEHSLAGKSHSAGVTRPEDLRPQAGSPAVDAGSPQAPAGEYDFFGNPRVVNCYKTEPPARPDAGAIELQCP